MRTLALLLLLIGFGANCQTIKEVNISQTLVKSGYSEGSERIAFATERKDTLYVLKDMYHLMVYMWNNPNYKAKDTPVFIKVDSLEQFFGKK